MCCFPRSIHAGAATKAAAPSGAVSNATCTTIGRRKSARKTSRSTTPLIDKIRHQRGPSGLMARADSCAVVAVEMLVEQQMIAPVGIGLNLRSAAEDRAAPGRIAFEDADQPF